VLMHTYGENTWGKYEPSGLFSNLRKRFSRKSAS
jgi:hypothetical protein